MGCALHPAYSKPKAKLTVASSKFSMTPRRGKVSELASTGVTDRGSNDGPSRTDIPTASSRECLSLT